MNGARGVLLLTAAGWLTACGGANAPSAEDGSLEVRYRKAGGWTATEELVIQPDGRMLALRLAHATGDTLVRVSDVLTGAQRRQLSERLAGFAQYRALYEPQDWHTDADLHTVVVVGDGTADTSAVYDLERADPPRRLVQLVHLLQGLWQGLVYAPD